MMCIYASPGSGIRVEAADDEVHLQHSEFLQGLPSQLSAVTWRTVLGFKALCALYAPEHVSVRSLVLHTR